MKRLAQLCVAIGFLLTGMLSHAQSQTIYRVVGVRSNDVLNLRERPDFNARIVGVLAPTASGIVDLGQRYGDWVRVGHQNVQGWANQRFLTVVQPPPPPTRSVASNPQAIEFPGTGPIIVRSVNESDSTTASMQLDRSTKPLAEEACYILFVRQTEKLDSCLALSAHSLKGTLSVYADCSTRTLTVQSGEPHLNSHAVWNSMVDRSVALSWLCPGEQPVHNAVANDIAFIAAFNLACGLEIAPRNLTGAVRTIRGVSFTQFEAMVREHRRLIPSFERAGILRSYCQKAHELVDKRREALSYMDEPD